MGELATLFDREIPKSRSSNEGSYPTLINRGELRVPREASGLGRRQLNELLVNTPYFRRHPEFIPSSSWTSGLARAGTRGSPRG